MKLDVTQLASEFVREGFGDGASAQMQARISTLLAPLVPEEYRAETNLQPHTAWILGTEGPLYLYAGHSDVVGTGDETAWTYPPFNAHIQDGVLYGRGSVDMRSSVAAWLAALAAVWSEVQGRIRIGIVVTGDEETKGQGAPAIIEALREAGHAPAGCIVGEPSAMNETGDQIRIGRRGSVSGKVQMEGVSGHTAYASLESNVLHRGARAVCALESIQWPTAEVPWPATSFHVTNFSAGTGENNVVPNAATFSFNLRFPPILTRADVIARCEETLGHVAGDTYSVSWSNGSLPYETTDAKFKETVTEAIAGVTGTAPAWSVGGGTSDGTKFAAAGIPTVEVGVPAKKLHEVNESLSVSDLEKLQVVYEAVIRRFAELG